MSIRNVTTKMENGNYNEAISRPQRNNYSLPMETSQSRIDTEVSSHPTGLNYSQPEALVSMDINPDIPEADASVPLLPPRPTDQIRSVEEYNQYVAHMLNEDTNYLDPVLVGPIDDTRILSRPLNVKVGRKPKKQRTRKHKRERHKIWYQTSPDIPPVPKSTRFRPSYRKRLTYEDADNELQPEANIITDTVRNLVMSRVQSEIQRRLPTVIEEVTAFAITANLVWSQSSWANALKVLYIYGRASLPPDAIDRFKNQVQTILGPMYYRAEDGIKTDSPMDSPETEDPVDGPTVHLFRLMQNGRTDWERVRTHPLFVNIAKLMGILSYVGYVKIEGSEWDDHFLTEMIPHAITSVKDTPTLAEAVFDLLEYVGRAAEVFTKTGEILPALSASGTEGLAHRIALLESNHKRFKLGLLCEGPESISDEVHYEQINDVVHAITAELERPRNTALTAMYTRELAKMMAMREQIRDVLERSPTRPQPFGIYFNGEPGGGKSVLATKLIKACIDADPEREYDVRKVYNRNASDPFWSGYTSDMVAINNNDMGASKDDAVRARQYEETLRQADTTLYSPNMAAVEDKGNVRVQPDLVVCSGNGVFPGLGNHVQDIQAFVRRYPIVPLVVPRDEYCAPNCAGKKVLDTSLLQSAIARGELDPEITECCRIFLYESVATPLKMEVKPIKLCGKHEVGVGEFLTLMAQLHVNHITAQRQRLKTDAEVAKRPPFSLADNLGKYLPGVPLTEVNLRDPTRYDVDVTEGDQIIRDLDEHNVPSQHSISNRKRGPGPFGRGPPTSSKPRPRVKKIVNTVPITEAQKSYLVAEAEDRHFEEHWQDYQDRELEYYASLGDYTEAWTPEGGFGIFLREGLRSQQEIPPHIRELGANHADFDERWGHYWGYNYSFQRWPTWFIKWFIPRDRMRINECLNAQLKLSGLLSAGLAFGPLALLAPLWACTVFGLSFWGMSSMFSVNLARRLHRTATTPQERLWIIANWRDISVTKVAATVGVVIMACQIVRALKATADLFKPQQSEFVPTHLNDPKYRQAVACHWNKTAPLVDKTHLSETTSTTHSRDLQPVVERNLYTGDVYSVNDTGETVKSLGDMKILAIAPGYALINAHVLVRLQEVVAKQKDNTRVKVFFRSTVVPKKGHQFSHIVDFDNIHTCGTSDVAVLNIPEIGDRKDIIKHFPLTHGHIKVPALSVYKNNDGELILEQVPITGGSYVTVPGVGRYYGVRYHRSSTFVGLCGSVLMSSGAQAHIMGIHAAGNTVRHGEAVACVVTQDEIRGAIKAASSHSDSHPHCPEGGINLFTRVDGFTTAQEPHRNSSLRYTSDEANFTVPGVCSKRATFISRVQKSAVADSMYEVCGVDPNDYRKPVDKPSWHAAQTNAEAMSISANNFPQEAIDWAYEDYYTNGVKPALEESNFNLNPLTDFQVLNGTGELYGEPMNRQTSLGEPLSGKKSDHMFEDASVEYIPFPEYKGPCWKLDTKLTDFVDEVRDVYEKGERVRPLFTACVKDEVHYNKDKARTFLVPAFPTTYFGRKYTLNASAAMRQLTTVTENTVGLNCFGPDGTLIYDFMTQHGTDRLIAGDFSKYDKKMPVSVLTASMRVYRDIARDFWDCEDKEKHIRALDAWTADVLYPYVNWFGDILQMNTGGTPSGIPITADVNGIANSLIHRCAYFLEYVAKNGSSDGIPPFRDAAALGAYGDDSGGGVDEECDWFDMLVMEKWCASIGLKYTHPSKMKKIEKFIRLEDFDFLKRDFSRIHECGYRLGRLDVSSIYKPLCKIVWDSKHAFNLESLTAVIIQGSMLEAFNHGRDFYERHQKHMLQIAEMHGLLAEVREVVSISFDQKLVDWRMTYEAQLDILEA